MNSKSKIINIAIIGGGAVTRIFYLPAFRKISQTSNLRLRFIIDPSIVSTEKLENLPPETEILNQGYDEFIRNYEHGQPHDGVIIALPHHLHEPAVCMALNAGFHVLCEKPAALCGSELDQMIQTAETAQKTFAICHYRRHYPVARAFKQLLNGGQYGSCSEITWHEGSQYRWPPESLFQLRRESGGEELFDIGAHVFDLLSWWLGDLGVLSYQDDSRGGAGADFRISLKSIDGVGVKVRLSRIAEIARQVDFKMEHGTLTWHLDKPNAIAVESPLFPLGQGTMTFAGDGDIINHFAQELTAFEEAILGRCAPTVSGFDAKRYVSVFDQCVSLRKNVKWTSKRLAFDWPWSNRKIAVTGAAGFIGCRFVEMALDRNLDVRALVHRPQSCVRLARNSVEMTICDILDRNALIAATKDVSAIFHCAYGLGSGKNLEDTVITGTQNVLEAARDNRVETVVLLSSMLAYGDPPESGIVNESSPINTQTDPYGRAKRIMSDLALRFGKENNLKIVILQPTCVYGPFSGAFVGSHVERMLSNDFYFIENGRGKANLVYIDNLIESMLLAAISPDAAGQHFIVNEDEINVNWHDYFQPICDALNLGSPPTVKRDKLLGLISAQKKQKSMIQLFREAVRSHPETGKRVAQHPIFRAWKSTQRHFLAPSPPVSGPLHSNRTNLQTDAEIRFIPNVTFVNLFDTQAAYSSASIRRRLGWCPTVKFDDAFERTLAWVRATWPVHDGSRR